MAETKQTSNKTIFEKGFCKPNNNNKNNSKLTSMVYHFV